MTTQDSVEQVLLNLLGHHVLGHIGSLNTQGYTLLYRFELACKDSLVFCCNLSNFAYSLIRHSEHNLTTCRDSVTHVATLPACERHATLVHSLAHKTSHQLVGVSTSLVNLNTRVTTTQATQMHLNSHITLDGLLGHKLHLRREVDTAGTTYVENTLLLRVEIQKDRAVEFAGLETERTKQTSLLVGRDKSLQRTVLQRVVLHNRHNSSNTDTVVGTKSCVVGIKPVTLNNCCDGVIKKVVLAVGSLLGHHIHVCLQDNPLAILETGCSRLTHNHITSVVEPGFHVYTFSKVQKEFLNLFQMSRRTGNLCESLKARPHIFGR